MATTASKDKDVNKIKLKTIAKQMTIITDLMAQLKSRDAEIKKLKEGEKMGQKSSRNRREVEVIKACL